MNRFSAVFTSIALPIMAMAIPAAAHAAIPPALLQWQSPVGDKAISTYWYDTDTNRYAFTSQASFASWFPGHPTGMEQSSIAELSQIKLAGAVPHRPGARLIKFESDPKVYAVSRFGMLRWLATEQVALELYGSDWTSYVDELSVANYPLYRFASPITDAAEYDRASYNTLTNPSSNMVNGTNRPPETFDAKLALTADRNMVDVGKPVKLTASVSETKTAWNTITIRFYDWQNQVMHTCSGTLSCSFSMTAGGPLGTQAITARAFNAYDQAVVSNPVVVTVSNPQ